MAEILGTLATLSALIFVVSSMASMGLSLKINQITAPLKNTRLVVTAIVVNFILIPIIAFILTLALPLSEDLRIGLILLSTAAGAPFLPKLADTAKGNVPLSVGLMVLLMVVTIVYLPVVLPFLLTGVKVNPLSIIQSLIVVMLIPLASGLFINTRYEETAAKIQPTFSQASNTALIMLVVLGLVLNFREMVGLVGSSGILAGIIFILASLTVGFLLGGSDSRVKSVMALGAGQRNIAAALVVAGQNFGLDVITYLMVISVLGMVILMPLAGELGRRRAAAAREDTEAVIKAA